MSALREKLDAVRRRLRRLLLLRGLALLLTTVVAAVLTACLADAWFHVDSAAIRAAARALIGTLAAAGAIWWLLRPWRIRLSDIELALRLERSRPAASPGLASGVEFDSAALSRERGSPALQQRVVEAAGANLLGMQPEELLDTRPVQRAAVAALGVCLLAAGFVLADRQRASIALERLWSPYSAPVWPRVHTLRLLDDEYRPLTPDEPLLVASGRPQSLFVEDVSGTLPDDVTLQAVIDGDLVEEPLEVVDVEADRRLRRLGLLRVPAGAGDCLIRVVGGDDRRMPWHRVRRISPPSIESIELVITPPEYAGEPVQQIAPAPRQWEHLVGSSLTVAVRADKPLQRVTFHQDGFPARPMEPIPQRPGWHRCDLRLDKPGWFTCWVELTDEAGLQNSPVNRYELHAREDREPVIGIEHPPSGVTATPRAELPFRIVAEDDVGLAQVWLHYSDPPGSGGTQIYPLPAIDEGSRRAEIDAVVSMPSLNVRPGEQLLFRAGATDHYDLGPEHIAESARHMVFVVTAEEKLHELLRREEGLAESLQTALDVQAAALRQTDQLRIQWENARRFRPEDRDLLRRVTHDASRIESELFDERRGALARVEAILAEFDWNRLESPRAVARLEAVSSELVRLQTDVVPHVARSLSTAAKSSADESPAAVEAAAALSEARRRQEETRNTLQGLLSLLQESSRQHDFKRSLDAILSEQEQLVEDTAARLLRPSTDDPDQAQADVARLADRQDEVARLLQTLIEGIQQSGDDPSETDASLQELASRLAESGVGEAMRRAADLLERRRIGEAATTQTELLEELRRLHEDMQSFDAADVETLLKHIDEEQSGMETLRREQAELMDALSSGEHRENLERLRDRQAELAERTAESARRLRRRQLGAPATSSSRAAEAMRAAADALQDEASPTARREQQEALDDLLQAERELADLRRELEMRHAVQRAGELIDTLQAHRDRQQGLLEQTEEFHHTLQSRGRFTRLELVDLQSLAQSQLDLAADVERLAAETGDAPVVQLALDTAAAAMHGASDLLAEQTVGEPTGQLQQSAIDRLQDLLDVLSAGDGSPATSAERRETAGEEDAEAAGTLDWAVIAEVRLLQRMQADVAQRLRELTRRSADEELTEVQQQELDRLSARQAELADLAGRLFRSKLIRGAPAF